MRVLRIVNNWLELLVQSLAVVSLTVLAVVIPYEVLGRKVLGSMPPWSGEISCFALVWVSMFGAAVGLRRGGYHVGMEMVVEKLPAWAARGVRILGWLVTMGLLGVLSVYGIQQVVINARQLSPALLIPMAIPYTAIPLGAMAMLCFTLEHVAVTLSGSRPQQGGE